jgi:hypothetical protein
VYAGAEVYGPGPSFIDDIVVGMIRSAVAGVGEDVSNGESGFLIRVTQKHLAMPSSPLMRATLRPRSSRSFMDPRNTQGFGFWFLSDGDDII